MATTEFNPFDEADTSQAEAEAKALEVGEKIAAAEAEDRLRNFEQKEAEAEPLAGKFKTPAELEKAYLELQKKLGEKTPEDTEEPVEEQPEASEETPEEEPDYEAPEVFNDAAKQYTETGELTEETLEQLSKMDQKDLIKQYMEFYTKTSQQAQQQALSQQEQNAIIQQAGGAEAYGEMVQWAAQNLDPAEIQNYNQVTNSGNPAAIRYAVEALSNRYKAANGNEAPLVTGKKAANAPKGFRSNAELARAIADPRYQTDPAYRLDVEQKLARSGDLL
jgi:hypothetical protein